MARILVAEDDPKQAALLRAYLEADEHHVTTVADGLQALTAIRSHRPDLLLLDIMMPTVDGWDVLSQLGIDNPIPVIVLTARTDETDQLRGFNLGADDYVTKPYSPRQVVARVRAVLRRTSPSLPSAQLHVGPLLIDPDRCEVRVNNHVVDLTSRELTLIQTLAESPGRVFSRAYLLQEIGGFESGALERTVDMHVSNVRRKIEADPTHPTLILTVKGRGYKLADLKPGAHPDPPSGVHK